jgi:hypothetical protein
LPNRKNDNRKISRSQAKQYRASVRKLQSAGLYTGKPDLRKRPSKYVEKVLKKYADVLSGKAAVIKAPSKSTASKYKRAFKVRGDNIIVPKKKGERVTIDKRGELHTTRKVRGRTVRKTITPGGRVRPRKPRKGAKGFYVIPMNTSDGIVKQRFESYAALAAYMEPYEENWEDWQDYVEFEEYDFEDVEFDENVDTEE